MRRPDASLPEKSSRSVMDLVGAAPAPDPSTIMYAASRRFPKCRLYEVRASNVARKGCRRWVASLSHSKCHLWWTLETKGCRLWRAPEGKGCRLTGRLQCRRHGSRRDRL
jgi:hypothetical protein